MKKIIFVLALILTGSYVYAQDHNMFKNSARVGINGAFFGYGDMYMPAISLEYSHALNKFIAISPGIEDAYRSRVRAGSYKFSNSFVASLSFRITPLPGIFNKISFDIGGLYHNFKSSFLYIFDYPLSPDRVSNYDYYKVDLFGLTGAVNYNFISKNKFEAGVRVSILTSFTDGYYNIDSMQAGIYIGRKF